MTVDHVERARQIADALDSPDRDATLHGQFVAEFRAWEAEQRDAGREASMSEFDRLIGRAGVGNYTGRIVRGVTSSSRAAWGSGSNRREDVVGRAAAERPQDIAKAIGKAPAAAQRAAVDALMADPATAKVVREAAEDDQDRRDRERMEANQRRSESQQFGTPVHIYTRRLIGRFSEWRRGLDFVRGEVGDPDVVPREALPKVLDQHRELLAAVQANVDAIEALMGAAQVTPEDVIEGTASRSPRAALGA